MDIKDDIPRSAAEAKHLLGILFCEAPNSDLHNFIGNFTYRPITGACVSPARSPLVQTSTPKETKTF